MILRQRLANGTRASVICLGVLGSLAIGGTADAQLRVASWNITNYTGGLEQQIADVVFGEFQGRSMNPDIILAQEILNQGGADAFLAVLNNTAIGGTGNWAAAPFDISTLPRDVALFYRTDKVTLLQTLALTENVGTGPEQTPRINARYLVQLNGYGGLGSLLFMYNSHMKAGSSSTDQSRRLAESQRIRTNSDALPAGTNFLLAGDFNMQSASQQAYQWLIIDGETPHGRFIDPIATPASWRNSLYRFIHTQDPIGPGGMDDRYDFIMISESLANGEGLSYIGNPSVPFSTTTWNDPNHSYRMWGNDGTSFNQNLRVVGNTMVGPVIAQAIIDCASNAGHIPVYLDLRVPARVDVSVTGLDFGAVAQGQAAELSIDVGNGANVALWSRAGDGTGIDFLRYSFQATPGFTAPTGLQVAVAGSSPNTHSIAMDTTTVGPLSGVLTITTNDPGFATIEIPLSGTVVAPFNFDVNGDGVVDYLDLYDWEFLRTDINGDGVVDEADRRLLIEELRRNERDRMIGGRR